MHQQSKILFTLLVLFFYQNFVNSAVTEDYASSEGLPEKFSYGSTPSLPTENVTNIVIDTVTEHVSLRKWRKAEGVLNNVIKMLYKQILPLTLRLNEELDLSSRCSRGIMKMLIGLKQSKLWAFKMFDSAGKLPTGLASGNINALGDYDLCLSVDVPGNFRGQYCTVDIKAPLPERRPFVDSESEIPEFYNKTQPETIISEFLLRATYYYNVKFRTSVCVPSTCSREEIEKIANKASYMSGLEFDILVPNCEFLKEKVDFSKSEIVIICILSLIAFLAATSTIVDVILQLRSNDDYYQDSLNRPLQALLCFSFYSNTRRLLKPDNSPDSIKIFHGIRVITILWIILIHTYYYRDYQASSFLRNVPTLGREIAFQVVINGFLSVETFFFMSGVLITYGVMQMKGQKINVGLYIFHRLWRLTPPFMLVIACVFLLPYVGSGPVWKETVVDIITERCRNTWWANILYINNFLPANAMCLQWLWYIPVDTHLYFLSLIVIVPLKTNRRLAFVMWILMFVGGLLMSGAFHIYYKLPPTGIYAFKHPNDVNYFVERGYFRTYLHCSTYCIGLAVGYFLATRPEKFRIPLKINLGLWLAASTMALVVLYGVYEWNQGNLPSPAMSLIYACTNKIVWSLALAWVTIACVTGHGGIAYNILTWPVFVPLARLTYMTYIVHTIIHFMYLGSTKDPIRVEHRTVVYMYLGNTVLSFMVAYVLSMLFECPFMQLEKILFSSFVPKKSGDSKKSGEIIHDIVHEKEKFRIGSVLGKDRVYAIKIKHLEANT